jgi:hypothetical protein
MTILRTLPVLLVLAACATRSAIDESRAQAELGQFSRAFVILDDLRREQMADGGEVDADLAAAYDKAKKAYLLFHAEELIFQEQEDAALADLVELETLEPGYPGVETLRSRAFAKKAERVATLGEMNFVRKDYVQALACFFEGKALIEKVNGHALTVHKVRKAVAQGIDDVMEATASLSVRGQEQFLEAVRKMPEFRFVEVQWHAGNSIHNTPDRDEARAIAAKARRENALASMARGKACEGQGRYGAALVEYRTAKAFDPNVPGIEAAIAAMQREQEASLLMDEAQKQMRLGKLDDARAALGKAFELSLMARNEIGALMLQTKRLEGDRQYQIGRDLEVLGRKAEALAAFETLAKDWPEGFADEKVRIDGLTIDIEGAKTEWAAAEAAEAAGNLPQALDHYLNSERFYAGWKDGKARIARLRAAIQPPAGGNQGNQGTG